MWETYRSTEQCIIVLSSPSRRFMSRERSLGCCFVLAASPTPVLDGGTLNCAVPFRYGEKGSTTRTPLEDEALRS